MYIYDIIEKKRKALPLSKQEIYFVIDGVVNKTITDAQLSSLLMAIVLNGMNYQETLNLTLAMRDSSEVLKFNDFIVDKHSTGGVSDSTTLIVVPTLASLGVKIGKMSGRALGFTGGTIDKLEVFTGYKAEKSIKEYEQIIGKINCSIISQTANIAYADKLIYALRNKTATVDSIPLIASSIMSKKLAGGAKFLLLNVTYGYGAFMKNKSDAIKLAKIMTQIGNDSGVQTKTVVSKMFAPLASGVGCSLEVESALSALNGEHSDLAKVAKALASVILQNVKNISFSQAYLQVSEAIINGSALNKLEELVKMHGGDWAMVKKPALIPQAKYSIPVECGNSGYVKEINAFKVAKVVNHLQQLNTEETTKKYVGVKLHVSVGSKVWEGMPIAELNVNSKKQMYEIKNELLDAFTFSGLKVKAPKLIDKIL